MYSYMYVIMVKIAHHLLSIYICQNNHKYMLSLVIVFDKLFPFYGLPYIVLDGRVVGVQELVLECDIIDYIQDGAIKSSPFMTLRHTTSNMVENGLIHSIHR